MAKSIVIIFLALNLMVLSDEVQARNNKIIGRENNLEIDLKLKLLNKPAVKSIQSSDGDIIDCVDIYKQPAFDHPALRNHTIQLKPSFHLESEKTSPSKNNESNSKEYVLPQTWQKSGSCPKGTVPIRRVRRQDLLRADTLDRFGKKNPSSKSFKSSRNHKTATDDIDYVNNTKLDFAYLTNRSVALLVTVGYNYIGAQGDLNIWNPRVASHDEYTTAQIWLKHGPGDAFESVEGGWTVNPKVYGDTLTRLFVYWTVDSYKSTGCFDLLCQGFVHTNPQIALGAVLEPWSSEGGTQYYFTLIINLDPNTGNWWVKVGRGPVLGYFPGELFAYLNHSAILVQWGGEVYSSDLRKSPHTMTAMGSGEPAEFKEGSACSIKNVRIIDYSMLVKYPESVSTWADEAYCYSALNYVKGYKSEPVFYFGGPSRGSLCP